MKTTSNRPALSRRQMLRLSGTFALTAPLLAACGGARPQAPSASANGTTTITEWGYGTDNTVAKARLAAFRVANPAIEVEVVPQINDQKVLTGVVSGEVPDLLWLGRDTIISWAARGALEPLDGFMQHDGFTMEQFYPATVAQVQYGGNTWAIPQFAHTRALFVNLDPLKQAGLSLDAVQHTDWSTLKDYGRKLTETNGNAITRWGFDPKAADEFFWMYSWGNGAELIRNDGKQAAFADQRNIDALQYVVDVTKVQGGRQAQKAFSDTWGWDAQHPFIQNQVALTLYDTWLLAMIAKFAPDHQFAVLPFKGRDGNTVAMTTGQAWAIPRGAKHRDAAWTFMRYMASTDSWRAGAQAQQSENQAKGAPYVPSLTANRAADNILINEIYKPINPQFDQVVQLLPKLLGESRSLPNSPLIRELSTILLNQAINPALLGTRSAPEGMWLAQERADQAIAAFA